MSWATTDAPLQPMQLAVFGSDHIQPSRFELAGLRGPDVPLRDIQPRGLER